MGNINSIRNEEHEALSERLRRLREARARRKRKAAREYMRRLYILK